MWTKWLLVLTLTIAACARISGLQNDLSVGYSYNQPDGVSLTTVPASLAYYINIPAGQSLVDYYYVLSSPESQPGRYSGQYHVQDPGSVYSRPQYAYNHDVGYNHQQLPDVTRVNIYRQYTGADQQQQQPHHFSTQPLPSVNRAPEFAPSGSGYQADLRSRSYPESPFRQQVGRNAPRTAAHPDYQEQSALSQELVPPPPYNPRETSQFESRGFGGPAGKQQFESKGFGGSAAKQQYRSSSASATASPPTSYNAKLPFAIGSVPIKFKPFPLKTHLRQSGLLPITSYQARESYKK